MRQATTRLARRAAVLATLVGALLSLAASPAAAAEPPGWVDPGPGAWVAFTFESTTLPRPSRAQERWGPVVIRRSSSADLDLDLALPGTWATEPTSGEPGWPGSWQLGGITLERVDWCPRAGTSCAYFATGGEGEHLFFAAGTPIDPDPPLDTHDQGTTLAFGPDPVLTINFSWNPTTARTPAAGTNPGRLTLDASGSTDQQSGNLSYAWTVTQQSTGVTFQQTGPIAQFDLDKDDTYCVAVTVTNDEDPTHPKTYGVDTPDCQAVDQLAPPGTAPGPSPSPVPSPVPGAGNGGGAGGGAGGGVNVVFAPPRRGSPALTGTVGGDSVVWLWRPEYFQPGSETTQALPQTGRNPLEGRTDIVIATDAPDSNAAPLLAGLGIFGVVGVGWLFSRWRRVQGEV